MNDMQFRALLDLVERSNVPSGGPLHKLLHEEAQRRDFEGWPVAKDDFVPDVIIVTEDLKQLYEDYGIVEIKARPSTRFLRAKIWYGDDVSKDRKRSYEDPGDASPDHVEVCELIDGIHGTDHTPSAMWRAVHREDF